MIRSLTVRGLNNKIDQDLVFHDDINVITGDNGSGKTTILKLIWYLISGNIERIPREMTFDLLELTTSDFYIKISRTSQKNKRGEAKFLFEHSINGKQKTKFDLTLTELDNEIPQVRSANHEIYKLRASIFFSTFRRIEGGFSMTPSRRPPTRRAYRDFGDDRMVWSVSPGDIQNELVQLSNMLAIGDHLFVTSISTTDIVALLTRKYAEISERTNQLHSDLSESIFEIIQNYSKAKRKNQREQLNEATESIENIATTVSMLNDERKNLLRPFTILGNLIGEIYTHKGIQVTENIVLGEKVERIDSNVLSSGEKQMLSFLCYNAFCNGIPFFIDEPEISLHVDWQRMLFPTLLSQESKNQFIIATHSPFIYSKYADKEHRLGEIRGDEG